MTLSYEARLRSILQKLVESDLDGMRLWDFLQWDMANHGVALETSHKDLEDLCTVQKLISMGEPYHLRTRYTGRPIFEPTVRVTEEGRRYLSSMTDARGL